jgi:hypothetical protein
MSPAAQEDGEGPQENSPPPSPDSQQGIEGSDEAALGQDTEVLSLVRDDQAESQSLLSGFQPTSDSQEGFSPREGGGLALAGRDLVDDPMSYVTGQGLAGLSPAAQEDLLSKAEEYRRQEAQFREDNLREVGQLKLRAEELSLLANNLKEENRTLQERIGILETENRILADRLSYNDEIILRLTGEGSRGSSDRK